MGPDARRGKPILFLFFYKSHGGDNLPKKTDPTVIRETVYVATVTVILSTLMEAVYLVIGRWSPSVLFGNLLGGAAAVLSFFLMGLTVQKALTEEEKSARNLVKLSMTLRFMMLVAFAVIGVVFFDLIASVLPLIFPSIAVRLRPFIGGKYTGGGSDE